MKYFNKAWYTSMQRTDLHILLKPDERASMFSEDFYQEVYKCELLNYMNIMREVHSVSLSGLQEKLWKPFLEADEMKQAEYDTMMDEAKDWEAKRLPYDEESVIADFEKRQTAFLSRNKEYWPGEIYNLVADPRVLALNVASPDIIGMIKVWCNEKKHLVETIWRAAYDDYQQYREKIPEIIVESICLHDVMVERTECGLDTLVLYFGERDNINRIRSITIIGCEYLTYEDPTNACWKYEELELLPDGRYRFGFLFINDSDELGEIELYAKDIVPDSSPITEEEKQAEEMRVERLVAKGLVQRIPSEPKK